MADGTPKHTQAGAGKTAKNDKTAALDTPTAIAAIVEPFKAAGALIGFAIGFYTTYQSGAAVTDAILHGLLGAALLFPVAWFLGLFLIREGIRASIDEQRATYNKRVEDARRQVMHQLQAGGMPPTAALGEAPSTPQLPPGDP